MALQLLVARHRPSRRRADAEAPRPAFPAARPGLGRWPAAGALAALAVPALLAHARCAVFPEDDAFINFKYADNVAAGVGPVYNPGEHVFGSSSPLFVAWLTALRLLAGGVPTPVLAVRLNCVPLLAAAAGLYVLVRRLAPRSPLALVAGGYLLLQLPFLHVSISGMETMLFLALVLWSLAACAWERPIPGAVLAACATLARPEGVFCLPAVALACDGRRWPRAALACAIPLALWVLPATVYYGTPVPQSVLAKAKPLYPLPRGDALQLMVGQIDEWIAHGRGPERAVRALQGVLAAAIAGGLLIAWRRRDRAPLVAASFGGALLPFYAVANPLLMSWYWPPVHVGWLLALLAAFTTFARIGDASSPRFAPRSRLSLLVPWVVTLWLGATTADYWLQFRRLGRERGWDAYSFGRDANAEVTRIAAYEEAARWLNRRPLPPRVAAPEIGAFGYYYRGQILDVCGLVSPEAVPYLPVPSSQRHNATFGAISPALVRDLRPPVIVTLSAFADRGLFVDPTFRASYREIHRVPLPRPLWYDSDAVRIFERVPGAP